MNFFTCLVSLTGKPLTADDRRPLDEHLRSIGINDRSWEEAGNVHVLARHPNREADSFIARAGSLIGVGDVRLDNREEIESGLDLGPEPATDLALALQAFRAKGTDSVARQLGAFAYIAWDSATRKLTVVRDTFGVKTLFYIRIGTDFIAFSSHASLLGIHGEVSKEYIAKHFLRTVTEEDTIYEAVEVVPAAHVLVSRDDGWSRHSYWSPDDFKVDPTLGHGDTVQEIRRLFADSVRSRMSCPNPVWSELSGGLDTSSVISTASWLHRSNEIDQGLAGTINYSDSMGAGDESEFVDAVLEESGLDNHKIRECWPWQNDGAGPMPTELPGPVTFFWSRNRKRNEILKDARAGVLLSGHGGDHLFEGNHLFFADRLAKGKVFSACGQMAHFAALNQESFWRLTFHLGLAPLLPSGFRSHLASRKNHLRIPSWVSPDIRRHFDLDGHFRRTSVPNRVAGPLPRYHSEDVQHIRSLPRCLPHCDPFVTYERRFPFLHRPLVELSLRLPPELKVHPFGRKYALREALRGVLPEKVRTRRGKGGVGTRMLWALNHEHRLLEKMLRDPVLAQMGFVDAVELRKAYEDARTGKRQLTVPLFSTLALETWLLIKLDRWPRLTGVPLSPPIPT